MRRKELIQSIQMKMEEAIKNGLEDISMEELEEQGAIYYMNGNNGTEFDWFVNEKLPSFMMFYDDEENLGAIKANLNSSGILDIYLYGEKGKTCIEEIQEQIDVSFKELEDLVLVLTQEADNRCFWGKHIESINWDADISEETRKQFREKQESLGSIIQRRNNLRKRGIISKMIVDEGYQVGYMLREEPFDENDSGWRLMAGNESDAYTNCPDNFIQASMNNVIVKLAPDIEKYLDSRMGTALIRIPSGEFIEDDRTRRIYVSKRKLI